MSNHKPYPAYKDSGVEWIGEVPEHWPVCKLNFRYSVELGKMLDQKRITGDFLVPYLRNQDVQWGEISSNNLPMMDISPEEFERYTAVNGDLLVCEGGDVGRAAIWHGGPIAYQKALHRLRPRGRDYVPFMYNLLIAAKTRGVFSESDSKATISHLPAETFRTYRFPFPTEVEQRAIVSALDRETDRIDSLIAKKTEFTELLAKKRQALTTHAVTKGLNPKAKMKDSGVEWIGEVPAHWIVVQLGKLAKERCDGPFGSGLKSEHYVDSGVRVVRLQNIGWAQFKNDNAAYISHEHWRVVLGCGHSVLPGDLLVAGLGDENNPLGRACVAPGDIGEALVKADCYRFRLSHEKALPSFVALSLSATAKAECGFMATGATRDRLNLGLASSRTVAIPPETVEQQEIVDYVHSKVDRIDRLAEKTQLSIDLLKNRRSALITAAVTGQIDLRRAA